MPLLRLSSSSSRWSQLSLHSPAILASAARQTLMLVLIVGLADQRRRLAHSQARGQTSMRRACLFLEQPRTRCLDGRLGLFVLSCSSRSPRSRSSSGGASCRSYRGFRGGGLREPQSCPRRGERQALEAGRPQRPPRRRLRDPFGYSRGLRHAAGSSCGMGAVGA